MPRNTSVTLGDHFDKFVSEQIQKGRFQSVSEAVRAGLRKIEEDELKLERLRDILAQGKASPRGGAEKGGWRVADPERVSACGLRVIGGAVPAAVSALEGP